MKTLRAFVDTSYALSISMPIIFSQRISVAGIAKLNALRVTLNNTRHVSKLDCTPSGVGGTLGIQQYNASTSSIAMLNWLGLDIRNVLEPTQYTAMTELEVLLQKID